MKRATVLCVLAVIGLALTGLADVRGYFVGAEVTPHTFGPNTVGIPYLTIGYDAGWGYAYLGFSDPGRLNTWLSLGGGGFYNITESTRVGGGLTFWIRTLNFGIADGVWSINFLGMYKFDQALSVFLRVHVPLQIQPDAFLLGGWLSFGLIYYIWGNAPVATTP